MGGKRIDPRFVFALRCGIGRTIFSERQGGLTRMKKAPVLTRRLWVAEVELGFAAASGYEQTDEAEAAEEEAGSGTL
jgi:hypothetical protein